MLKGTTWLFNSTLDLTTNPPPTGYLFSNDNGLFTCDSVTYTTISFLTAMGSSIIEEVDYISSQSSVTVYTSSWANSKYKTITFIDEIDGIFPDGVLAQFETWLKSNATKTDDENSYLVSGDSLISIANAIRSKSGGTSPLSFPYGFQSGLYDIVTVSDIDLTKHTASKDTSIAYYVVEYRSVFTTNVVFSLDYVPVGKCDVLLSGVINIPYTLKRSISYTKSGNTLTVTVSFRNDTDVKGTVITNGIFTTNVTYYSE